ncbi:MAG: amidohydrolase [Pseudomonadota bacterium]|nr:amidohydrolase [Pseudomonadota bacterium]
MRRLSCTALLCLLAVTAQAAEVRLLTAARIHTSDPAHPLAEAIAWSRDGRVLAVGGAAELAARYPAAERIDARDAIVIPGLIDAHGHVMGLGHALLRADLVDAADKAEVIARLLAFARDLPEGAWLLGRGWDQNRWPQQVFPTAADLDAAFPDRPVWLERIDGHAGWANSAAMRAVPRDLAGDWQPEGGRILRGGDGLPSGVFIDTAAELVESVVPPAGEALREQALQRALDAAVRNGLTGVHDMGTTQADLALMRRFADADRLPLRIAAYADGDREALADLCAHGLYAHPGGRLQMRGVKLYVDGALGSRGAALLEDYSDEPGHRGLLVTQPAEFEAAVRKARGCGVQVAGHAIGDRGNRIVLDTFAQVLGAESGSDHRWRVEHAQVVALEDIPRFAQLGVIASMQPTHATSDMPWAEARVGTQRLQGAYAWRRLLDAGARLALGSDFPVESVDPRLGLQAAVTRQDRDGHPPGGWLPGQRLRVAEALHGFTRDAAYAGRDESALGRLAPGLRADFVLLDGDPLTVPPDRLHALRIRATWVDGEPVYIADDTR